MFAGCPSDVLETRWDSNFIALGTMISVLSAFTGLTTATYAFTVLRRPELQTWYSFYSVSAGISIGGGAIWVMHFVGMQALIMTVPCTGQVVRHTFNIGLTFTSLVAACLIGGMCMRLVMPAGGTDATPGSPAASPYWRLPFKLRGHSLYLGKFKPARFAAATVALVAGVCVMHNMGLIGMYGPYWTQYDPGIVFASAALALVASSAGLFIVVQCAYVGSAWYSIVVRGVAALVIGGAVNAVHYVGMTAAKYHYTGDPSDNLMHHFGPNVPLQALGVLMAALLITVAQLLGTHAHIAHLAHTVTMAAKVAPAPTSAAATYAPLAASARAAVTLPTASA